MTSSDSAFLFYAVGPWTRDSLRWSLGNDQGKHSILLSEQYADPRGLDHVVGPLQLVWYAEKMTLSNMQSAIAAVSIDQYHVSGPNIQSLSHAHRLSGNVRSLLTRGKGGRSPILAL